MEQVFHDAKSANLNLRLSYSQKARLVEEGRRHGLNLTDYALFLMEKGEKEAVAEKENGELLRQLADVRARLETFESLLQPLLKQLDGNTLTVGGEPVEVADEAELLATLLKHFKFRKP